MKYVVVLSIVLSLCGVVIYIGYTDPAEGISATGVVHNIVLTEDGYNPHSITIALGDAITFSVDPEYGEPHWPASNMHPSHRLYSEFDPLSPLDPDAKWSFVFGRVGEWRFHDHLAPYYTGIITVQ